MTGSDPDDWKTVILCSVYKKERLNCANYGCRALFSHAGKLYERNLETRLRQKIEHMLTEPQHAFRPGRRTINLTFAFKNILEKSRKYAIDRHTALLDLEKAFDPGEHSGMPRSKPEYRIPPKLIRAVKSLYASHSTTVTPVGKNYSWFEVSTGVRQGSVLPPLLFIILTD